MPISKNKKIVIYLFLLIIFGSINNKHLITTSFFEIKNLRLVGLNSVEKENLLFKFEKIKKENIFFLKKKEIIKILNDYSSTKFIGYDNLKCEGKCLS